MNTTDAVRDFYNSEVMFEWNRLVNHPIEFEINKRFMCKYIKKDDRVLDIGGGPGRYRGCP